jgi:PII-like signaling protein
MFLDEDDMYEGDALYEHVLRYLMHHDIMGATMFKGYMGFGAHHHLHKPQNFAGSDSVPVMVVFVDANEKVQEVLPHLKTVLPKGLIVTAAVERV